LSPQSPFDSETQSQSDFTKGDNLENSESPLVTPVTFVAETLKPGGECIYKKNGHAHWVIGIKGDEIKIQDWYGENPPFTVALDEVTPDTPGPKREKKKKAK
jgi:hypothetical protein